MGRIPKAISHTFSRGGARLADILRGGGPAAVGARPDRQPRWAAPGCPRPEPHAGDPGVGRVGSLHADRSDDPPVGDAAGSRVAAFRIPARAARIELETTPP